MNSARRPKALVACANAWRSPLWVGDHHIARELVERGYEVAFVSHPISPFHLILASRPDIQDRFENALARGRWDLQGRLFDYVPFELWPSRFADRSLAPPRTPATGGSALARRIDRVVDEGFGQVDLLYIREARQHYWLDAIQARRVVYRIADRDDAFGANTSARFKQCERRLAGSADLVVYSAPSLRAYARELGAGRSLYIPNGVWYEHFQVDSPRPAEYSGWRQVAVYVGSIDDWFDFEMVIAAALQLPEVLFALVGPLRNQPPTRLPDNVQLLGARPFAQIPAYLRHAQVGLIPFDRRGSAALVDHVQPLKLWEYFASGLPVVATRWPELERLATPARLVESDGEFVAQIREFTSGPLGSESEELRLLARAQSWSSRVETLLGELGLHRQSEYRPARATGAQGKRVTGAS